jgi:hypothetical protein
LGGSNFPSHLVPLSAVRADQDNLVMAVLTFEGDVKTALILTLLASVKLLADLPFNYPFHNVKPPSFVLRK